MRVMVVHPGPHFSVADVHRGLVKGLEANGVTVIDYPFDVPVDFFAAAHMPTEDGAFRRAFDKQTATQLAGKFLEAEVYRTWPDVIVFVSAFWLHPETLGVLKKRGHRLVLWATESPYEDDRQAKYARYMDVTAINDPINLQAFLDVCPGSYYAPQSHDPDIHKPGPGRPEWACDVAFVGTAFPERIDFMSAVDWSGIDLRLGGYWVGAEAFEKYLVHPVAECMDNTDTIDLYRSAKASWNFYRRTASWEMGSVGWSMGPREVELAASGTFFLRDPRPEGDRLLSMLPTFHSPDDFASKLRWWLRHDDARQEAAEAARAAVADRTFTNSAARLLEMVSAPQAA